ncbi:RNA polymerase sigma factor SigJ [soil metagenome]
MNEQEWLAQRFEEHRAHLRAVAYRMLGSFAEADEAVQDAWLRVSGSGAEGVESLGGWLTTIVARVCLNVLRSRKLRDANDAHVPDLVITHEEHPNPEHEALLADSVGLALQVVLDTLEPAERLAFVLHDMFDLPFDDIAPLVGRTPDAARQLASRARRRVRGAVPDPEPDIARQREVVDAFFATARAGSFEALVEECLIRGLPERRSGIDEVAHALHMSRRTLQRRLGEEDQRFETILDALRRRIAERALSDDGTNAEISYLLGYSSVRATQRSIRRWFGARAKVT